MPLKYDVHVALYLPWCKYIHEFPDVTPQLYADKLCISSNLGQLLRKTQFTVAHFRLVGQEPAPTKCISMSTSVAVRKDMKTALLSDKCKR